MSGKNSKSRQKHKIFVAPVIKDNYCQHFSKLFLVFTNFSALMKLLLYVPLHIQSCNTLNKELANYTNHLCSESLPVLVTEILNTSKQGSLASYSLWSHRVGHDWVTEQCLFIYMLSPLSMVASTPQRQNWVADTETILKILNYLDLCRKSSSTPALDKWSLNGSTTRSHWDSYLYRILCCPHPNHLSRIQVLPHQKIFLSYFQLEGSSSSPKPQQILIPIFVNTFSILHHFFCTHIYLLSIFSHLLDHIYSTSLSSGSSTRTT